ncbi:MAG TPA: aminoglycoside phosphotransferase family protein [Acidimicrobiales bacterium]|nr:aminoglycoside phosphotransferase family protein [Acidimicrobiales bacterium]
MVDRSSEWPPVSTSDAVARLRAAGVRCSSAEPIEGGWASWTFLVDGALIARFPRNGSVAAAHQRERALLPALARHMSFRVPEPFDVPDVFVYERIEGRPFRAGDDVDAALAMIHELHTFPVDEAQRLLDAPPRASRLEAEWDGFVAHVFPLLDASLVARLGDLRAPPLSAPETLIHADLGPEHVLVGDDGAPVGIIDFEDAGVGDPEMDLLPVTRISGRPITDTMWRYSCRGTLHALRYYVGEGLHDEIPGAVEALRRRLDARPPR